MARPRPHHRLSALACTWLLLSACTAQALSPATESVVWPEPEPDKAPMTQPQSAVPMLTAPDFRAPSASHCRRPIRTREVPGGESEWRQSGRGRAEIHGKTGIPHASMEAAPAAAYPAPTPMPKPPLHEDAPASAKSQDAIIVETTPSIEPPPPHVRRRPEPRVTAGMVDDNADFAAYLAFRDRTQVPHRARDIRERYQLLVKDASGRPVPDAEIAVRASQGASMWARTDTSGRVWVHPNAFDPAQSGVYEIAVRHGAQQARGFLRRGQKSAVEITLSSTPPAARAQLDLVFMIDATGSMADEIGKLKASLAGIANEVARLPSQPDLCFGMVAYRDKGDAFLLRSHDFTNDLNAFQGVLNALRADAGGDYAEAMNEALHETVHQLSWRGNGTTRMVVLLADAPPHLDYGGPQYDDDMLAALGKGIKIFSVGASGLDRQGEYIQRQIAQYTGGRFVFLTYADANRPGSGPGRETTHDVSGYSVDTLDRLIVRLVSEELARLPQS